MRNSLDQSLTTCLGCRKMVKHEKNVSSIFPGKKAHINSNDFAYNFRRFASHKPVHKMTKAELLCSQVKTEIDPNPLGNVSS